eukprot:scaffold297427_cov30-Tisochrysis_lutea.AAC.3
MLRSDPPRSSATEHGREGPKQGTHWEVETGISGRGGGMPLKFIQNDGRSRRECLGRLAYLWPRG